MSNVVDGDTKENNLFSEDMGDSDIDAMLSNDGPFNKNKFNHGDKSTISPEHGVVSGAVVSANTGKLESAPEQSKFFSPKSSLSDVFDGGDRADVGLSWATTFWAMLFVGAVAAFLLNSYRLSEENRLQSAALDVALQIQSDVKDISYQSLLVLGGNEAAVNKLHELRDEVDTNFQKLEFGETGIGSMLAMLKEGNYQGMREDWNTLGSEVDIVIANRDALSRVLKQVQVVDDLTAKLLAQIDKLVGRLIESDADLSVVNTVVGQRFLSQRIEANANALAMRSVGWRDAVQLFQKDINLFGRANQDIRTMGDYPIDPELTLMDASYEALKDSADIILGRVDRYAEIEVAIDNIANMSTQVDSNVVGLLNKLRGNVSEVLWIRWLPFIIVGIGLIGVIGIIWSLKRQNAKQEKVSSLRVKRAEGLVIKLIEMMGDLAQGDLTVEARIGNEVTSAIADPINFSIMEMRELVRGMRSESSEMSKVIAESKKVVGQFLSGNKAQSEATLNAVGKINETMNMMRRWVNPAVHASDCVKMVVEEVQPRAAVMRDIGISMKSTRHHILDIAQRLKRLDENAQQISDASDLVRDVTEQIRVLSLNVSIQASIKSKADQSFELVAEEMQRLADRASRSSSEIPKIVKNIQEDAYNTIASMQATSEEISMSANMIDESVHVLDDIERNGQELINAIARISTDENHESMSDETIRDRMDLFKSLVAQSDSHVSQVAVALEKTHKAMGDLDKFLAGFKLPN